MATPAYGYDFDSNYAGESIYHEDSPLRAVYGDIVPWDIGAPQPVVVRLADEGGIEGHVLDVGCGLGANALFLARRGYQVTACDVSPNAVERARERAKAERLDVRFEVADAVTMAGLREPAFDTVIDSALYHGLDPQQRRRYTATLHRCAATGARLHVVCFSDAVPAEILAPNRCSEQDVRDTLSGSGWSINRFERTTYTVASGFTREVLLRAAEVTGATAGQAFVDALGADEQGRLLLPMWLVSADRVAAVTPHEA